MAPSPEWLALMHPNDTLQGRLLAHELPEEKHLRRKLGYWRMVEERMITGELIAAGHDPRAVDFMSKVTAAVMANHANDVSYADDCARRWANRTVTPEPVAMTAEEWAFIADHFDGANHPVAQAIMAKAGKALERTAGIEPATNSLEG